MHIDELGKYIREYRINNNYSQQEFAEILGISKQTLSAYEQGTAVPAMPVIMRFIEHSGASPEELTIIEEYINKIEAPEERSAAIEAFSQISGITALQNNSGRTEFFNALISKLRNNIKDVF